AYAARAGLTCAVLVPEGGVAMGKMAQALIHGASVLQVRASFDAALDVTRTLAEKFPVILVNSVNPDRIQGQKTLVFEVCDALERSPDAHVVPVGNAGNITSHWLGYREEREAARIGSLPAMFGFQAEGAAPIVLGEPVAEPETVASAIRIGNPASWSGAVEAAEQSGGEIRAVSDEQILVAHRELAREGLFVEPASAASVAGLGNLVATGRVEKGSTVVCVLTGHGLKDPQAALDSVAPPPVVEPDPELIAETLEL
ncbi:MAG TPA: threonine synthase, partial [Actinomycetota bacterium]|nr:threonine synthase [Actinomycetota bacterium]